MRPIDPTARPQPDGKSGLCHASHPALEVDHGREAAGLGVAAAGFGCTAHMALCAAHAPLHAGVRRNHAASFRVVVTGGPLCSAA
jgi:hypothetical protein